MENERGHSQSRHFNFPDFPFRIPVVTLALMKRVLASLLLLVYFTVSTGFVVSLHYCMDRFDSAELGRSAAGKCQKCGMHKDGCCHDEVKVVKLQLAHVVAHAQISNLEAPLPPAATPPAFEQILFDTESSVFHAAHGPPLGQPPAYLLYGVFRL